MKSTKKKTGRKAVKARPFEILKRRADFLSTVRSGRRVRPSDWVVFNFVSSDRFRCGWTVPGVVGGAVLRNRLKRWSREWLRAKALELKATPAGMPSVDLNIGYRAMPNDFYRRLRFGEFVKVMETGWAAMTAVSGNAGKGLKRPIPKSGRSDD